LRVAGGELGIDEIAGRNRGIGPAQAAALAVERQEPAATLERVRGVAADPRDPLCGLGAPQQALRGPARIFEGG
jgi:hypothetical protein